MVSAPAESGAGVAPRLAPLRAPGASALAASLCWLGSNQQGGIVDYYNERGEYLQSAMLPFIAAAMPAPARVSFAASGQAIALVDVVMAHANGRAWRDTATRTATHRSGAGATAVRVTERAAIAPSPVTGNLCLLRRRDGHARTTERRIS